MNKSTQIVENINIIGDATFAKLKELNIPPYPKYYHDTFIEELFASENPSLIELTKRYKHLFDTQDQDNALQEISFDLAKNSLQEFEKSNEAIKEISDKNIIDITQIKREYERVKTDQVINVFDNFQSQILQELKKADETIHKLKLEIERLERESHIDPLTKTYNRRVFLKDLQEVIQNKMNIESTQIHLILLDADDFKDINDNYGHIAGDKTLIFLSKLLQNSLQKGIKVYRYGGEEFAIILQNIPQEEAKARVENVIKEVSESKLLFKGHTIHLTVSAGMATLHQETSSEPFIEAADKALYQAKQAGKNRLEITQ